MKTTTSKVLQAIWTAPLRESLLAAAEKAAKDGGSYAINSVFEGGQWFIVFEITWPKCSDYEYNPAQNGMLGSSQFMNCYGGVRPF